MANADETLDILRTYLPLELQEHVLHNIELPRDLAAFAATCKYWARLIMPRHVEYRVLRLCSNVCTPGSLFFSANAPDWIDSTDQTLLNDVLFHLASSPQLASGIREVDITQYGDNSSDTFPRSLIRHSVTLENTKNSNGALWVSYMQQALINMKSLSKFTWQISLSDDSKPPSGIALPGAHLYPTVQQQRSLFETLRNSKTLTSLNVNIDSTSDLAELIIPRYPLWHIGVGNLTFLKLTYFASRDGEVTKAIGLNIINMLQRNSLLQQLYIQYNSEHAAYFKSLRFPYLQKLGFGPLDERDSEGHDDFLSFIYAHRSLEDLMWNIDYNCSGIQLDFLPRLKSFSSNSDLIIKTMWGNAQCNLEQIYAISLTTETLIALRRISFPCRLFVKNIQFSPCDSPDLVEQAVLLFPNITVLMAFCLRAQYSLEQLITTLSELPFIEEVHVEGICDLIRALPNDEKRTFFLCLGNTCPRLRRLGGHPNGFSLIRDGEEVTWKSIRL